MKHATFNTFLTSTLLLASMASLHAANLYWDGGTVDLVDPGNGASLGGAGTWDTTIKNWDEGAAPYVAWNNTTNASDSAYFGGTAGTVTAGSNLVAGSLLFNTNGYAIDGAGYNLTLNGVGGIGIGPASFGKSGTSVSGFNVITLGGSQKWDAWSSSYGIDLTVSGGSVDTNGYTLTLGTSGRSAFTAVTSEISGSGNLDVNANGGITSATTSLGNANTYTGTTTVNGYVQIASLQNVGTAWAFGKSTAASSNIVFNNGGFRLNGTSSTDHGMTFTGSSTIYAKQKTGTLNGQISGSGTLTIRGDYTGSDGGNGTVVLAAANDYSGSISAGLDCTLRLAHVNAMAQATLDTTGTRNKIDLTTNNLAYVIGGLKGNRDLNLGTGLGSGGSGAVLIGNNSSNTYSGVLSGSAGFTKTGAGTQTLGGINTYTGDTTVSGGTLVLADDAGLSFVVTDESTNQLIEVGSGAVTLDGDFTIDTSAVTVTDGTWTLVDLSNTAYATAFTDNFTVNGFTPDGDGVTWTLEADGNLWTFSETDGILTLGAGSGLSEYDQWATGAPYNLSGADALAGADPDKDGVINLVEYALNGDPTSGADNGIAVGKVQDVGGSPALTLTIATRSGTSFDSGTGARVANNTAQGVNYRIEGGTDLSGWLGDITEITAITDGLPDLTGTDYEYHTFKTAGPVSSTPKDFIRVKVTE